MFNGKINENYAWEISGFRKIRSFKDGITFFDLNINFDKYLCDHSPRFQIEFIIFNIILIDFSIYFIWHRDDNGNPIKPDGTPIKL